MEDVLTTLMRQRVESDGDRPFLWCEGDSLTYAELWSRSMALAEGLRALRVEPGDRVALLLPNRTEMIELYFGVAAVGAVQVPLNAFLKGEFLQYQLADSEAKVLVTDAAGWQAVEPLLDRLPGLEAVCLVDAPAKHLSGDRVIDYHELRRHEPVDTIASLKPDDLMSIVYTSGTTGLPKGCMLPHEYYLRVARYSVEWHGLGPDDVHLSAMPLFHAAARLGIVGAAMCTRGKVAIMSEFSASRMMKLAAELDATVIGGVGAMGLALLNQDPGEWDTQHHVRRAWFVPFTPEQEHEFGTRFGVPEVSSELYGQTECFPITFSPRTGPQNSAADGLPAQDLDVRLVDDDDNDVPVGSPGEIIIRPHRRAAMFQGYWRKPEATLAACRGLWYRTGDYGKADADGFIAYVDRKKDALRRRGENVSSVELENAILRHPAVAEVAVHAVPSDMSEDDIKACIVLHDGSTTTPEELFASFVEALPYYAIPRYVDLVESLPRNAVNRVMKHQLRDRGNGPDTWDFEALGLRVERSQRR